MSIRSRTSRIDRPQYIPQTHRFLDRLPAWSLLFCVAVLFGVLAVEALAAP